MTGQGLPGGGRRTVELCPDRAAGSLAKVFVRVKNLHCRNEKYNIRQKTSGIFISLILSFQRQNRKCLMHLSLGVG